MAATDEQVAAQITAATAGLKTISFGESSLLPNAPATRPKKPLIQAAGFHTPPPEGKNPPPDPPPGGWSNDPLMRAAQKIAYGHAFGNGR